MATHRANTSIITKTIDIKRKEVKNVYFMLTLIVSPHLFILFYFFRVISSLFRFYFMPLTFNLLFIMLSRSYYSSVVFYRHKGTARVCVCFSEWKKRKSKSHWNKKTTRSAWRASKWHFFFLLARELCMGTSTLFFRNLVVTLTAWRRCLFIESGDESEKNKKKIMLVGKCQLNIAVRRIAI